MPPRQARILPFPPPRGSAPPGGPPPRRSPAGVVATLSIDAKEVARLVARDLADEWVKGLIADHQRRSGPPSSSAPVPCGAPRRHPPHAPCRSTGRLANGRCRWHQGPERTSTQVQSRRPRSTNARALSGSAFSESPEPWAHRQRPADSHGEEGPIGVDLTLTKGSHDIGLLIWNDLSIASDYLRVASDFWARHVSGDRAAPATVDHSDIRGSRPHGRHPSGAASD